ncbi:MAG: hypothetical protein I3273_02215 [Candidatus Moeniiplasma glomeromycotorum]|nr:hypothetical protein [Candidatus Moeniiplasma glomeromycotorum]MCE8167068.1 hypothetical protein [Candidatus Moeniiplasma glomeromycotorum]MCE8168920.1 hypothetical protein [Candidatus Moeniiplasma glomeromycotorum]
MENQQSQTETEKNLKEQLLAQINDKLREKDQEINRLKNKQQQSASSPSGNSNSTLLKWAISLSIVAIIIGILALLAWLKPRQRDR